MAEARTAVYLEVGSKRVFACAVDWPGWCRSGRGEREALEALAAYAPRYAPVAAGAGQAFGASHDFAVIERVAGSATTDFGAPAAVPACDHERLAPDSAARLASLVAAAWVVFDRVVAGAPAELRKGPRGGGRDRDRIAEHVLAAEVAYARKLGVRLQQPDHADRAAVARAREAIAEALRGRRPGGGAETVAGPGWPLTYMARRVAWHVLDHAWEIEDRT
ncbi:MAG TPA: hypothetical protein VKF59_12565 [Candidatus Dormibacteraeota bacterium]|nr:hypothetical protein [Candidatus Dormibacteraeota bacterium]